MENDLIYYRRRLAEETRAASQAVNVKAQQAHLELARRYQEKAAMLDGEGAQPRLHIVTAA